MLLIDVRLESTHMVELLTQKWQNLSLNNDRMIKIQKSIIVEHNNAILPSSRLEFPILKDGRINSTIFVIQIFWYLK